MIVYFTDAAEADIEAIGDTISTVDPIPRSGSWIGREALASRSIACRSDIRLSPD
jgi:hypothetical protein